MMTNNTETKKSNDIQRFLRLVSMPVALKLTDICAINTNKKNP